MSLEIIDDIRDWHRKRNAAMEVRKRADLALGANLRTWFGWRKDLPEADRKRIEDMVRDLIACGEKLAKGKPHPLSDTEEFKAFEQFILMSIESRKATDKYEDLATREMEKLGKRLPVWATFAEGVRGFGARSLAVIVGEAADLSNYASHSKLWKRMGLAVIDGVRQGGLRKGAGAEAWIDHGYNPMRRAAMWNIGDSILKAQIRKVKNHAGEDTGERMALGKYGDLYLARKEYERNRAIFAGKQVVPAAKIPKGRADEFMSDGHVHDRAQRYMEKRLLRDLWKAWRRANLNVHQAGAEVVMPSAASSDAAQAAGEASRALANHRGIIRSLSAQQRREIVGMDAGPTREVGPPRKSRKAPPGAVSAKLRLAKVQASHADTTNSVAPRGAGQARYSVPQGATKSLPARDIETAE